MDINSHHHNLFGNQISSKSEDFCILADFNENWYLGVLWSEELVGALNSDMGVAWGRLCLHPNTIIPSYYYYSSSSPKPICPTKFSST
jgi:hypothetical protein